jgi:membrane dipeptidase
VPRNVPDDVLAEVKKNGGVVMVTFVPGFTAPDAAPRYLKRVAETERLKALPQSTPAAVTAAMEAWDKANPAPKATLARWPITSTTSARWPASTTSALAPTSTAWTASRRASTTSASPALLAEPLRRGYSEDDVQKIAGRNVLRVMRAAEGARQRLQKARGPRRPRSRRSMAGCRSRNQPVCPD